MPKQFTLFLFTLLCLQGFSQSIDSLLEIQRKADPQEKIYVQFDKNYYNPGETIWFKAYLFAGGEPSTASKNFYAELIDENNTVLSQKTAPVSFAGASGSFDLDSAFNKPVVYFRAYTIAALNSDTSFLFTKPIRVLSSKALPAKATAVVKPTIYFLPEGGDLTAGLPANIAFLATGRQGLPVAVSGSVSDNTGTKVADFKTVHDGMGSFAFTPTEGKTYSATWKAEAGSSYTTPLPSVAAQGISLRVVNGETSGRFTVYRSANAPEALQQLRVIGAMNQHLVFQAAVNLTVKTAGAGVFPTKDLPTGILQVTVFNKANQPVAERIIFVNNHDYEFDGDVYIAQKAFTRRGLNKVELIVSDTIPANLSLSITDAALNESNPMDDNIISHLLLTSDLRGKIVNPYDYFFTNTDSSAYYLDLVMLTHGWRRYDWQRVWAGTVPPARLKESNFLSLSGQIAGMAPGSYSPDLQLMGILQTSDSARTFISLPVDRKGNVYSDGFVFFDKASLLFNFNKKNLSFDKSMLLLDNGLRKNYKKVSLDSMIKSAVVEISASSVAANTSANKKALLAARQLAKPGLLENVTVTARTKTPKEKMEEKYVRGLFTGDANSFDLVNDPLANAYQDIFQYLQGKVAGLQITGSGGTASLSWRGGSPALYLNEMQTDASMLSSTPVSDIAYVKVFRPGSSIVTGGGNGVIAIYTRKGGDAEPRPDAKGLSAVQLAGYSPIKQFYSPDYATASERDAVDDMRPTLYWNPAIYLDKTRRHLRLQFYNNDITKRFRLVLEGINADGKLIHVEKEVSQ